MWCVGKDYITNKLVDKHLKSCPGLWKTMTSQDLRNPAQIP